MNVKRKTARGLLSAFCLVLLAIAAAGQETGKTIRDARDVLPESIVKDLDKEKCMNLLRKAPGQPIVKIFVLVNPALDPSLADAPADAGDGTGDAPAKDVRTLKAWMRTWAGDGENDQPLVEESIEALTAEQDGAPALYSRLKDISKLFMEKFFSHRVEARERLVQVINDPFYAREDVQLAACFNVRCWQEESAGRNKIIVRLTLRVQRIEINRNTEPFLVENVELLFRDEAIGQADLPNTGLAGRNPASYAAQVQDAYQIALVDALRNKIALSLWHNARMAEKPWVFGKRDNIVSPSLSDTK